MNAPDGLYPGGNTQQIYLKQRCWMTTVRSSSAAITARSTESTERTSTNTYEFGKTTGNKVDGGWSSILFLVT